MTDDVKSETPKTIRRTIGDLSERLNVALARFYHLQLIAPEMSLQSAKLDLKQMKRVQKMLDELNGLASSQQELPSTNRVDPTRFVEALEDSKHTGFGSTWGMLQESMYVYRIAIIDDYISSLLTFLVQEGHLSVEDGTKDKEQRAGLTLDDLRLCKTLDDAIDQLVERRVLVISFLTHRKFLQRFRVGGLRAVDHMSSELVGRYVEAVERRHLYAHNGGIVSHKYLQKLRSEEFWRGQTLPKVGDKLKFHEGPAWGGTSSLAATIVALFQVTVRGLSRSQDDLDFCGNHALQVCRRLLDAWDLSAVLSVGEVIDSIQEKGKRKESEKIARKIALLRAFVLYVFEKERDARSLLGHFSWADASPRELIEKSIAEGKAIEATELIEKHGSSAVRINEFREDRMLKKLFMTAPAAVGNCIRKAYTVEACEVLRKQLEHDGDSGIAKTLELQTPKN